MEVFSNYVKQYPNDARAQSRLEWLRSRQDGANR